MRLIKISGATGKSIQIKRHGALGLIQKHIARQSIRKAVGFIERRGERETAPSGGGALEGGKLMWKWEDLTKARMYIARLIEMETTANGKV